MTPLMVVTLTAALAGPTSTPLAPPAAPLLAQAVRLRLAELPGPPVRSRAPAQGASRRDPLTNGAKAGAIAGGLIVGGYIAALCIATDDTEGHGDCVAATALWGGLGAAAGAAIGAGIDALFERRGGYRALGANGSGDRR